MNSQIETTLETAWWRNVMEAVALVCGLALAAVLAFGAPDLKADGHPSRPVTPVTAASTPRYPHPGPAVVYIVASESDRLALEPALSERAAIGGAEVSILVADQLQAPSPYDILADEVDPSVRIIDLREVHAGQAR